MDNLPASIQILIFVLVAAILVGVAITLVYYLKQQSGSDESEPVEAPKPSRSRVAAAPPPGRTTRPSQRASAPAPTTAPPAPPPEPVQRSQAPVTPEPGLSAQDFAGTETEPVSASDELQDDDEDWGAELDIAPSATAVEPPSPTPLTFPEPRTQPTFEDEAEIDLDEGEDYGRGDLDEEELDAFITKELRDISRETQQSFTQAIIERDFSISKMKEADEISQKCVATYLDENEVPKGHSMRERLFAIHPQIQVSDLPQFAESYLDDGSEENQEYFADLEEMCDQHEESVLDLFLQFNSTLPKRLKCSLVGETKHPINAVIFLAPEWDESDFAKPDFGEDEEDVDEEDDFYEDYYEDLEELEGSNDDEDER